jgi:hypothetical protein
MKYAVLFAGIVFGCSSDPGGVQKPPPAPPGVAVPGPVSQPFDCAGALARFVGCMRQPDIDATNAVVLNQTTTEGPCYSCHSSGWFPQHPELIAECASNGLVFYDGIGAYGQQSNGTHPQYIMSTSRKQALRDFFLATQANCP